MPETNKEIAAKIATNLRIPVFSAEYKILLELYDGAVISRAELLDRVGLTLSTFQRKIAFLIYRGLVYAIDDNSDGRRRTYGISENATRILDSELKFLQTWPADKECDNPPNLSKFIENLEKSLLLRAFSSEYRMILGLYDMGEMSSNDLHCWTSIPHGTYYAKLQHLIAEGVIIKETDEGDMRRSLLRLSRRTTQELDNAHNSMKRWAGTL